MNVNNVPWKAEGGSIFTLYPRKVKMEYKTVMVSDSVAFNVGQDVAERIVRLHNDSLTEQKRRESCDTNTA
jgi:hypothetical protein